MNLPFKCLGSAAASKRVHLHARGQSTGKSFEMVENFISRYPAAMPTPRKQIQNPDSRLRA